MQKQQAPPWQLPKMIVRGWKINSAPQVESNLAAQQQLHSKGGHGHHGPTAFRPPSPTTARTDRRKGPSCLKRGLTAGCHWEVEVAPPPLGLCPALMPGEVEAGWASQAAHGASHKGSSSARRHTRGEADGGWGRGQARRPRRPAHKHITPTARGKRGRQPEAAASEWTQFLFSLLASHLSVFRATKNSVCPNQF